MTHPSNKKPARDLGSGIKGWEAYFVEHIQSITDFDQAGCCAMIFWEGYISDEVMGTLAPIVVYWLYAGFYHLLPPLDRFRQIGRAHV